jgi:hypothetical protein
MHVDDPQSTEAPCLERWAPVQWEFFYLFCVRYDLRAVGEQNQRVMDKIGDPA